MAAMSAEDARETSWQFAAAILAFYALIILLPICVCCCICCCVFHHHSKKANDARERTLAQRVRVQGGVLRVEAAFRDAQDGFRQCELCGFENFKRFPSCALCGTPLPVLESAVAASREGEGGSNQRPQQATRTQDGYMELRDAIVAAAAGGDASGCGNEIRAPTPSLATTERQKRARRRKEWTRRADVHGDLFWFRDDAIDADMRFPGYTLSLSVIQQQQAVPELEVVVMVPAALAAPVAAGGRAADVADDEPARFQTSQEVTRGLEDEIRSLTLSLTLADLASPAQATVTTATADTSLPEPTPWLDVLQMAAQDFPTKYAHFVARTSAMLDTTHTIAARVVRLSLLDDSLRFLSFIRQHDIRSSLRVTFADETGIDAGGLKREWFEALTQQLADPAAAAEGVFTCVNQAEQTYTLSAGRRAGSTTTVGSNTSTSANYASSAEDLADSDHLLYCFGAGRLVGRALLEGHVLAFHLALPLLKVMLGQPMSFSDLAFFDPELHASTLWVLEHDGVDALGLTFSVTEKRGGDQVVTVVDLIPNGRDVAVTDANKREFLERRFRYLLFERVASELYTFLKGVYEVIPLELLAVFDSEELDYVLSGADTIDVDDWEKHAQYEGKFASSQSSDRDLSNQERRQQEFQRRVVRWFWEIVREMPDEYRRRLLHFATGSFRAPIAGFSALTSHDGRLSAFTLYSIESSESEYISSHACFNRVGLPRYESKAKLELVLYATLDTELYGFTTA